MQCKKCGKTIPDRALRCPYCNKKTANGWKNDGEKLLSPIIKVFKNPYKDK